MLSFVVALPGSEPTRPVAAETVRDVAVAAIAFAARSSSGMEGAAPAVAGARDSLVAAARAGETDWPAALLRAFLAASQRIDTMPARRYQQGGYSPEVSLTCAVITDDRVVVAWTGGMVACLFHDQRIVRESAPHTMRNLLLIERKAPPERLAKLSEGALGLITRTVGPTHFPDQQPDIEIWPALEHDHKLVLAHPDTIEALRRIVPSHLGGRSWLEVALASCPAAHRRFGAMITR